MASTEHLLLTLLRNDHIRDQLLPHLSTSDLCALRQSCSACRSLVTKRLFTRLHVTFAASTFTRPSRVQALARVGHHVEHLTFCLPHSSGTFLPPLIHPRTGDEISFLYTPLTSVGAALTRPKYASTELGDILTQQYPPLFHAATNVPSFIGAFRSLAAVRHLTVRCPGQRPAERYRRDVVDYALISLRIAVERAPLTELRRLSLSSVHPAALSYLRHVGAIGSVPSAARRWGQIRKLHLSIEAWDFDSPDAPGRDHLKIIDDYVRHLAPKLEKLSFSWIGGVRGPCPFAPAADDPPSPPPLFAASSHGAGKLFREVTSSMSPLPGRPARAPVHMPALRRLHVRNTAMTAPQLSGLIAAHRATVKEFDFENVALVGNGRWDDALAPVSEQRSWSRTNGVPAPAAGVRPSSLSSSSRHSLVTSESGDDLLGPSAAAEAASRELRGLDDVDMGGSFGFDSDEQTVTGEVPEKIAVSSRQVEDNAGFSAKIRKKKRRKCGEHHRHGYCHQKEEKQGSKHKQGRDVSELKKQKPASLASSNSSSSQLSLSSLISPLRRLCLSSSHSSPTSSPSAKPRKPCAETIRAKTPTTIPEDPFISSPILSSAPQPVLLQPTVYDPSRAASKSSSSSFSSSAGDDGITAVQRNIEREEAHRLLAEDAAARVGALRRAREAVVKKLTREFSGRLEGSSEAARGRHGGGGGGGEDGGGGGCSSAAVAACRVMAGRALRSGAGSYYLGNNGDVVLEDRGVRESRSSAVVPLMLSRV